jgi:uncharacterized protein with PIN domain
MKASLEITKIELAEEFRICPQCGYELGFHSSFLQSVEGYRIILICPECGARYDVGWRMYLDKADAKRDQRAVQTAHGRL